MTFPFPILLMKGPVFPGSQLFTTPGTFQFQVPEYNTLTVTVRGGGGQGFGLGAGYNGGNSSFNGDVIGEGGHAPVDASAGGAGGNGIGGDQNFTGGTGGGAQALIGGSGGNGANGGGAGGSGNSAAGQAPGGGGSGGNIMGAGMPGGGGGGCAVKTYHGELPPGAIITVVVGDGGNLAVGAGGRGARGQVDISWN